MREKAREREREREGEREEYIHYDFFLTLNSFTINTVLLIDCIE